jgi:hypothetical protein
MRNSLESGVAGCHGQVAISPRTRRDRGRRKWPQPTQMSGWHVTELIPKTYYAQTDQDQEQERSGGSLHPEEHLHGVAHVWVPAGP